MPFAVVSLCSSGVREPVKTLAPSVESHFYSFFLRMGMELAEKKEKKIKQANINSWDRMEAAG